MSKRLILTIITLVIFVASATIAIFFAKGYSISKEKRIVGSGILTITSEPDAAPVYLDGHLITATNANIGSLSPKDYAVKVSKEGFIPWERQVVVKEGLVTDIKITLFPAIPTVYPLTFLGVANPVLSADGSKLAYTVPSSAAKKAGIWVWTMSRNQPISFARSAEPHQIASSTASGIDFSKAALSWSPDSKQVLVTLGSNFYLLDSDNLNNTPQDVTPTIAGTQKSWDIDEKTKEEARRLTIKNLSFRKIASDSAEVLWSPDETKIMVSAKEGSAFKVYDLETGKDYAVPPANMHTWLPDSRHIILVEDNAISIVDFDGTNKAVIYAGTFTNNFVVPWPDSSRLVILNSIPTPTASQPNLYSINLR